MNRIVYFGLLLVLVGVAVLFYFLDPNTHEIFPRCLFHSLTGGYCPGCGSQRAFHSLVHMRFGEVVEYNFLFLPATLLILYHYTHSLLNRIFKWKLPNIFYEKLTPRIILMVVLLFWIARNLPWYPFTILAPGTV